MRNKFQNFMYGRHGNDRLNRFLYVVTIILLVLSFFFGTSFLILAVALLVYTYFRMFSKNNYKRDDENERYCELADRFKNFWKRRWKNLKMRRDYRIYKCPTCGQKLRIPKGHGKVEIRCKKCGTTFIRRS